MVKTATKPTTEYYVKTDRQASAAAREEMESQGIKWLTLDAGDTYVRILPPHPSMRNKETGAAPFYHHVSLHFGLPGSKFPAVCPRKTSGGALNCPICTFAFGLKDAGQEKAGNDLLPSWQAYMNVLVIDSQTGEPRRNKSGDVEVLVWSAGRGTLDKIFAEVERREKKTRKPIDITDPDEGYVLEINRVGKSKEDTKYAVYLADEPTSIMDFVDVWGPELVDVTEISKLRAADELKALLTGGSSGPDAFDKATQALPAAKKPTFSRGRDEDESVEAEYREVPAEPEDDEEDAPASDAVERLKKMVAGAK